MHWLSTDLRHTRLALVRLHHHQATIVTTNHLGDSPHHDPPFGVAYVKSPKQNGVTQVVKHM